MLIYNQVHKIILYTIMVCLSLVILLIFSAALFRWIGYPIQWAVDISQILFAWIIFLGADLALQEKKHIGIEFFEQHFPQKCRIYLQLLWGILIAIFLGVCIYFGIQLCLSNYLRRFNSLPISYSWMTLSVPVGSLLMFITNIEQLYQNILLLRGEK